MTQLSEHFTEDEFECRGERCCGGVCAIHPNLLAALETIRTESMAPLYITSGFRCKTHNERIGGSKNSYHCRGMAADIRSNSLTPDQLAAMAKSVDTINGIGVYNEWVHIDVRKGERVTW